MQTFRNKDRSPWLVSRTEKITVTSKVSQLGGDQGKFSIAEYSHYRRSWAYRLVSEFLYTAKNKLLWKWDAVYAWAGVTLHISEVSAKKENTSSQPRRSAGPTSTRAHGRNSAHGEEVQGSHRGWGGQGVVQPFKRPHFDFLQTGGTMELNILSEIFITLGFHTT